MKRLFNISWLRKTFSKTKRDLWSPSADNDKRKEEMALLEKFKVAWRQFIYLIEEPVLIIDGECRLVEMNNYALEMFSVFEKPKEGAHLIDILEKHQIREPLLKLLADFKNSNEEIMRSKVGVYALSVFSPKDDSINYKYTIVVSRRDVE